MAVPSVVAHSYFTRKIETMAARLEVLLGGLIGAREMAAERGVAGEDRAGISELPGPGR